MQIFNKRSNSEISSTNGWMDGWVGMKAARGRGEKGMRG
jgi:hypothetical protein